MLFIRLRADSGSNLSKTEERVRTAGWLRGGQNFEVTEKHRTVTTEGLESICSGTLQVPLTQIFPDSRQFCSPQPETTDLVILPQPVVSDLVSAEFKSVELMPICF